MRGARLCGLSEASFERGISVVSAPVRDQSGTIARR